MGIASTYGKNLKRFWKTSPKAAVRNPPMSANPRFKNRELAEKWSALFHFVPGRGLLYLLDVAAIAAVYFGSAKLGLTMAFVAEQVTAVWPPTGIALAVILLFGTRFWPGVFLGAFLANATTNAPPLVAFGIAAGNTLEALVGALLLGRVVRFNIKLERLKDVLGLVALAAVLSPMVSATVGVNILCSAGLQSWKNFGSLWWVWWLGDATSDLVFA